MLQVPEAVFKCGEDVVILRGDFLSGMEYRALTGSSFEEAWDALRPQLLEHEIAKAEDREPLRVVSRDVWDTMFMDLFFAFSAGWRRDQKWDSRHRGEDDPDMEPRLRGPYVKFARTFPHTVLKKLRVVVFGLLNQTLSDPSEAAAQGEDARPTPSESPSANENHDTNP